MTPTFTKTIKRQGSDQPPAAWRMLRAGPLSLVLEGADLRYIRLGDREVLRRVYVALRDRNWGTVPPVYSSLQVDAGEDRFAVEFDAVHCGGAIDFAWHGTIRGDADGTIAYTMHGVARRTFLKNRIGLCVLHPMSCAGAPCTITRDDGSQQDGAFPIEIAPDQPFADFQAIAHEVFPGVYAEVHLSGDTFEMEDQRNWTDASYKTYSTPLRLPYPTEVREGTVVAQSCTLTLAGAAQPQVIPAGAPLTFTVDPAGERPLPRLGLGVASHGGPLTPVEAERLRALHLAHLRVDLDLGADNDRPLVEAARQARALGVLLEVALHLGDDAAAEVQGLREQLLQVRPEVVRWLVFHKGEKATRPALVRLARQILGDWAPAAAFGGGTDAFFAELNRSRPPRDGFDLVCYSINPQAHAFDNASLVESLAAQAVTLESARAFCGPTPLAISPVTLRPRFNPNATGPTPAPAPGTLPPQVDQRQMSLFGACWTLGSIAYLAAGGAASATYYETTGWRGVMETEGGPPLPEQFRSRPGMLFPLYHVLADVGEFSAGRMLASLSSDPLAIDGLALRDGARLRVLVANMTGEPREALVVLPGLHAATSRHLDEESFERAAFDGEAFRRDPGVYCAVADGVLRIPLRPYGVARIDGEV